MLTKEMKQSIYQSLITAFEPMQPQPMARVVQVLNADGHSYAAYGYSRAIHLLSDLPEYITLERSDDPARPDTHVIVRRWEQPASKSNTAPQKIGEQDQRRIYQVLRQRFSPGKLLAMGHVGNVLIDAGIRKEHYGYGKLTTFFQQLGRFVELPGGEQSDSLLLLSVPEWEQGIAPAAVQELPTAAAPTQTEPLTETVKMDIYRYLTRNLPIGETLHMAIVSKCLFDSDYHKERFGFNKAKDFLKQLGKFMDFSEVEMGGVPQTQIVIKRIPEWDQAEPPAPPQTAGGEYTHLPQELRGNLSLDGKTPDLLNEMLTGVREPLSAESRSTIEAAYANAYQNHTIWQHKDAHCFDTGLIDADGYHLQLGFKKSTYENSRNPWFFSFAGRMNKNGGSSPGRALENFAFLKSWAVFLQELADMAMPEQWEFKNDTHKDHYILQKYIQYTFYHLELEDKVLISKDNTFAAFNTGLVTSYYDDIYACFGPNSGHDTIQWRFTGFCTAAGRGVGKRLVESFSPLPQPPSYLIEKVHLLYDFGYELHIDDRHIIIDNISRLPLRFLKIECSRYPETEELVARIESLAKRYDQLAVNGGDRADLLEIYNKKMWLFGRLAELVDRMENLYMDIRGRINDEIKRALRRVRWNYKAAIPCFFPTRNVMSLMLPLALVDHKNADVALVVERLDSVKAYQGHTILTMQQAYINARLLCRPDNNWLDPTEIHESSPVDSDD